MEELLQILPELSEEVKTELEQAFAAQYEKGLEDAKMEFEKNNKEAVLSAILADAGSICDKATLSLIDLDEFAYENGEFVGLAEALEEIKKEYSFLFKSDIPQFSAGSILSEDLDLSALNYMERLKLFKENPELYRTKLNK